MRYTTIVDISQTQDIYRNQNLRLVYLHLCLRSGYHDDDRDKIRISIRKLADEVGLTVSATRHALGRLQAEHLLTRDGETWMVKKYILDTPPTPRQKTAKSVARKQANNLGDRYEKEIQEWRAKVTAAVRVMTADELQQWRDELEDGISRKHHGVYLNANQNSIAWLTKIIDNYGR